MTRSDGPRGERVSRIAPSSFRGQIVLSTVLLTTAVMLLAGLGTQIVLELTAHRDIDRVLEDRADAAVSILQHASSHRLRVPPGSLDPGIGVFDASGHLVAGSIVREARPTANALVHQLAHDPVATTTDAGESTRLRAVPFATPSGQRGVVVVSQDKTPYERSELYALIVTIVLGVLVVAIAGGIAWRVTRQALRPVRQMAERAAEWSEHDLSHRFALGPPGNELAALGETLDHLLDRVAQAIRSEQRLTSELAHELRTPLTAIQGSADLALLRGTDDVQARTDLEQIASAARSMAQVITALLDLARDPAARGLATCTVGSVVDAVAGLVPRHLALVDEASRVPARLAASPDIAARALAPLVENAARHARTRIRISAAADPEGVSICVADDGPGLDDALRRHVFEPGASGSGGTGLGLGIARRVARSLGGDILVGDPAAGTGGASFVLRVPRG